MLQPNTVLVPVPAGMIEVVFAGDTVSRTAFRHASTLPGTDLARHRPASPGQSLVVAALIRYFAGDETVFEDCDVDLRGRTEFSRQVLTATRRIPYGQHTTYGEIARRLGRPGSARAVGQALHRNPAPVIIPCHRVLGSRGELCGYAGGLEWKARLLALESRTRNGVAR